MMCIARKLTNILLCFETCQLKVHNIHLYAESESEKNQNKLYNIYFIREKYEFTIIISTAKYY